MVDTHRLEKLTEMVQQTGAKLVAVGDGAGSSRRSARAACSTASPRLSPNAALSNVRRTLYPEEQKAWANLRAGRSDKAMAHYHAQGRLHLSDTRDQAVEHAVQNWAKLTETFRSVRSRSSRMPQTREIGRMNARAQHHRAERGELGEHEVPVPAPTTASAKATASRMIDQHHQAGQERIRERKPRRDPGGQSGRSGARPVRRHRTPTHTRRRGSREPQTRVCPAHPPRPRRDRHAHDRRDGRLADQQGARLCGGITGAQGHDWFIAREELGHRRAGPRPHQDARRPDAPEQTPRHLPWRTASSRTRSNGPGFHHPLTPSATAFPASHAQSTDSRHLTRCRTARYDSATMKGLLTGPSSPTRCSGLMLLSRGPPRLGREHLLMNAPRLIAKLLEHEGPPLCPLRE